MLFFNEFQRTSSTMCPEKLRTQADTMKP